MSQLAAREIVVVGAGLAGLSAASTLAGEGAEVTLLERRAFVGGRAYSYPHPALEEVVDSQHVLLGCCTSLIELCEAAGVADKIRWYDQQTFLEAGLDGAEPRVSTIALSRLPAPLHFAGSFARAAMLSTRDKLAIARGLSEFRSGYPADDAESVAQWYRRTRQTVGAIRHFWEPIVLATLNDSAENCSTRYAGKVFYELFLKTRTGGRLGIPTVPLSTFFAAGAELVGARGGEVKLRSSVERMERAPGGGWLLHMAEGSMRAEKVVLALPFDQTERLLAGASGLAGVEEQARAGLLAQMAHFVHSPFLSVLLWYDREITQLDHAWLLDTTIQWFFHKSRIRRTPSAQGSYVELVIAGARDLLAKPRAEILEPALAELARFFPKVRSAKLLKSAILKEARATFSVTPGLDRFRPAQAAAGLPGLFLAGDWTRTDWPSTMEGAVRSGRLAADTVRGRAESTLAPELPSTGLMRWLELRPVSLPR